MKTLTVLFTIAFTLSLRGADLLVDTNIEPTTILVKYRMNAKDEDVAEFHGHQGGKATKFKHVAWNSVKLPLGKQGEKARQNYERSRLFQRVQPNYYYYADLIPNDPQWSNQWGPQKIQAPLAWENATATPAIVAIVDTGIDFDHPDLRQNLWTGPAGEHGYTAFDGVVSPGGVDDFFHGTHVAGTVAASLNNGIGIAGLGNAKLLALKFLRSDGRGTTEDAALCIQKMVELKLSGENIRVANHSWGSRTADTFLQEVFTSAENAGILSVCSAGNNGLDIDTYPFSPAGLPNAGILSVLASDKDDTKAPFSNYGLTATDLLAPGVLIVSCKLGGDYWYLSGTSMASPHVSGVAAMLFGRNPGLSVAQCKAILLHPSSLDAVDFKENLTRGGRLNFAKAMSNAFNPPQNAFPILKLDQGTNFVSLVPSEKRTMSATGSDADGDVLSYVVTGNGSYNDDWLIRNRIGLPFIWQEPTNRLTISNSPIARELISTIRFMAIDGAGGNDTAQVMAFMQRDESKIHSLEGAVRLVLNWDTNNDYAQISLDVDASQIDPTTIRFSTYYDYSDDFTVIGCCEIAAYQYNISAPKPGVNLFRAYVMDNYGNFANAPPLVVDVGNTGQRVPVVKIKLNTTRGPSPLEVVADLSETDPGGDRKIQYSVHGWRRGSIPNEPENPIRKFTLTNLGLNAIAFTATDPTNKLRDEIIEFFTVLPPLGATNTNPPVPQLIAPSDLRVTASQSGQYIVLTLNWSDTATLEDRWNLEYRTKSKGPWSAFKLLASLAPGSITFSFIPQHARYEFRIKACKDSACSQYSNLASIRL